jgi:hypothetical protein
MVAGAAAAFASTLGSMRLVAMLERGRSLRPYAAYRTALAAVTLAAIWHRRRGIPATVAIPDREAEPLEAAIQ